MKKRAVCVLAILLALLVSWQSAGVCEGLTDVGLEISGSSVHYPAMEGNADISRRIVEIGEIEKYLSRMPLLASSREKLQVQWEGGIVGNVVSVALHMTGAVASGVHDEYSCVNLRLPEGDELHLADVLTSEEQEYLLQFIKEQVEGEMSPHCPVCDMSRLPDDFRIVPGGIVLYYPMSMVTTLSERPGKVKAAFAEFLPDGYAVPAGSVVGELGYGADFTGEGLGEMVAEGRLEGIGVALGENAAEVIERCPLAEDADLIENGRILTLDDGEYRGVQLVTDRLTETFTSSVINGIRVQSGSVAGLVPGITCREDVVAAIGEGSSTLEIGEEKAELNRIVPGVSDWYVWGENRLRLHYNDDYVLSTIWLTN